MKTRIYAAPTVKGLIDVHSLSMEPVILLNYAAIYDCNIYTCIINETQRPTYA